ncbi:hypothetical protein [Nocardia mangyaensis]|uniref:hypothetical protein n=1 Tax=Nocardia mangyaensis TaxID=2213200 RepID=UPI0012EC4C36|nr:hypothetical protein [Nocardia mangyaensis]
MPRAIGKKARRVATVLTALSAVSAALLASAPGAAAQPGHYDFHPNDTRYRYEGKHGTFTGDAVYARQDPRGGNRLIWSLRLSPYVQNMVQGPMSCGAAVVGKSGYHDSHPSIPADYFWHSTITGLQLDRTYTLAARCDFTANNGHTTAPGNVQYTVEFTLHSS